MVSTISMAVGGFARHIFRLYVKYRLGQNTSYNTIVVLGEGEGGNQHAHARFRQICLWSAAQCRPGENTYYNHWGKGGDRGEDIIWQVYVECIVRAHVKYTTPAIHYRLSQNNQYNRRGGVHMLMQGPAVYAPSSARPVTIILRVYMYDRLGQNTVHIVLSSGGQCSQSCRALPSMCLLLLGRSTLYSECTCITVLTTDGRHV